MCAVVGLGVGMYVVGFVLVINGEWMKNERR